MRRLCKYFVVATVLLALTGCATHRSGVIFEPSTEYVWPVPPDMPRIAYMHQIHLPADAGVREGMWGRVLSLVAGRRQVPSIEQPVGIYADTSGRLIVADTGLQVVHIFNTQVGSYAQAFALPERRLASPVGVAFDPDRGWIFVSDSILNRIFIFDEAGYYIGVFGEGLKRVSGLSWDVANQRLIAADTGHHRVLIFDADGRQIQEIGARGSTPGTFNFPTHVAVNRAGQIYVTDSLNFRVQRFSTTGEPLSQVGGLGQTLGRFSKPKGVAVDDGGRMYVVDSIFDVVQMFDDSGRLLMHFGGSGSRRGQFWLPAGIAVAGNNIYVADTQNRRVQVFRLLNADAPAAN